MRFMPGLRKATGPITTNRSETAPRCDGWLDVWREGMSIDIRYVRGEETERLLSTADQCYKLVLKAEWVAAEPHPYYSMTLECGHNMRGSEDYLKARVMCLHCLGKAWK